MLLGNQKRTLAPVIWQIGRRGEAPDIHPGVVMDLVTVAQERLDGSTEYVEAAIIACQFTARPEMGGHKYIALARKGQPIPTGFLWPRAKGTEDGESLLIPELDNFKSVEELQGALQKANADFLASGEITGGLDAKADALAK